MPRAKREKSTTGIYHVMLRGINQQEIFEEPEDYDKFISVLKDCKEISKFKLYAYCLMSNHIHLLIKEEGEDIGQIIKRIGSRFVYWYNTKYQRAGHLFQDRYRSEPLDDPEYFNTVLIYIHRNPVKAQICEYPKEYTYSSYNEYVSKADITDTDYVLSYWNKEQFEELNDCELPGECLDVSETRVIKVTDEEAKRIIKRISKCENSTEFQALEKKQRDKYLKKIKEKGVSIRQISRLTGVSYSIIQRL